MTQITKEVRLRVFDHGEEPPSGSIDFTITVDVGAKVSVGRQRVNILTGAASTQGGRITIVDASEALTARLATGAGRADLLRRVVDVQVDEDGGGWATVAVRRLMGISESGQVGQYEVDLEDERTIERGEDIWTTNETDATKLYASGHLLPAFIEPMGSDHEQYGPFDHIWYRHDYPDANFIVSHESNTTVLVPLSLPAAQPPWAPASDPPPIPLPIPQYGHGKYMTSGVEEQIKNDIHTVIQWSFLDPPATITEGSYKHLRCRVRTTADAVADYEVLTIVAQGALIVPIGAGSIYLPLHEMDENTILRAVVVDNGGNLTNGATIVRAHLYMPSAPPTDVAPLFVGGRHGIHPVQLAKQLYEASGVRIDAASFTALIGRPYPRVRFRISGPAKLGKWLQENIFKPFMLMPLIDDLGRISLASVAVPRDADIPGSPFTFSNANTKGSPTFRHRADQMVTRCVFKYMADREARILTWDTNSEEGIIIESEETLPPYDHDRVDDFGVHEKTYSLRGIHERGAVIPNPFGSDVSYTSALWVGDLLSRNIFDRFGDGPVDGRIKAMGAAAAKVPSDFVKIDVDSYPDMKTGARGGARIVQLLAKEWELDGYEFDYLDAGPDLQPLSAPTVTATKSSDNGYHWLDVNVSAFPSNADYVIVEIAANSSTPGATSELWGQCGIYTRSGSGTFTVPQLASGLKYYVRAYATGFGYFSSDYSSSDDATLDSLPAPTISVGSQTGSTAVVTVSAFGNSNYPIRLELAKATCASGGRVFLTDLEEGRSAFTIEGMDISSTYCVSAAHIDDFGGVGSEDTAQFATTATLPTCPDMAGLVLLVGGKP